MRRVSGREIVTDDAIDHQTISLGSLKANWTFVSKDTISDKVRKMSLKRDDKINQVTDHNQKHQRQARNIPKNIVRSLTVLSNSILLATKGTSSTVRLVWSREQDHRTGREIG